MKRYLLCMGLTAATLLAGRSTSAAPATGTIPDRPESLEYATLDYEPPDPAEFRVVLESGPVAYVASDRELPLVNITVLIRAGHYLDPEGKEGLAGLTGYLLTKGGTPFMTAEQLEERLAFLAANLSSGIDDFQGTVTLNLLSKDLDEGLALLRSTLSQPRFQQDKLALRKEQMLQSMKQRNDDSAEIEMRERDFLAYGEAFWSNQYETERSINSITQEDIRTFHQQWFHPDNFVLAVSGDFDREEMIQRLETAFADWPFDGQTPPPIATNTVFAEPGVYLVNKDVNQGRVSVMLPGVMRSNPDYFPITLMNRILGGGGFTSRIVNRVRSDEGLAYSAYSLFRGGIYYPEPFVAAFQTKSGTVAYAISIVLEEIARMAETPVTAAELETAKRSMIDTFPRAFASKQAVVTRFARDEFTGRFEQEPHYYRAYRDRMDAVTVEDVQRVAQTHLRARPPTILVVGSNEAILSGHPDHVIRLQDLTEGAILSIPLRDPMTMEAIQISPLRWVPD